jgi:hypothetical protein
VVIGYPKEPSAASPCPLKRFDRASKTEKFVGEISSTSTPVIAAKRTHFQRHTEHLPWMVSVESPRCRSGSIEISRRYPCLHPVHVRNLLIVTRSYR